MGERLVILIHGHDTGAMLEQGLGVPTAAEGAIKKQLVRSGLQNVEHLLSSTG
jgi:hypothetical protein